MLRSLSMAAPAVLLLLLLPRPVAALPLLSEVFYDAVGADDGQSFVEIAGTPGTALDGWTVEGVNGSNGAVGPIVTLSGVIGADGLFVLADGGAGGVTLVPGADLVADFDFQNGPDSVVLADPGGLVADALGYGSFGAGDVNAGEGSPAPDPSSGSSLARRFADLDTDDNAADFQVLTTPTPGQATFASLPEPGVGVLAGMGLGGLLRLGRRTAASRRRR